MSTVTIGTAQTKVLGPGDDLGHDFPTVEATPVPTAQATAVQPKAPCLPTTTTQQTSAPATSPQVTNNNTSLSSRRLNQGYIFLASICCGCCIVVTLIIVILVGSGVTLKAAAPSPPTSRFTRSPTPRSPSAAPTTPPPFDPFDGCHYRAIIRGEPYTLASFHADPVTFDESSSNPSEATCATACRRGGVGTPVGLIPIGYVYYGSSLTCQCIMNPSMCFPQGLGPEGVVCSKDPLMCRDGIDIFFDDDMS